jgi:hypothetical protein
MRLSCVVIWLFLYCVLALGARAEKLALLIGNQGYDTTVGPLENPHNDIALIGRTLKSKGFEVLEPLKDAKRLEILSAVHSFTARLSAAGPEAIGFLYYSGHGAANGETGKNYLIPIDAKRPNSTEFWYQSVKLDEILDELSKAPKAVKFVVFDACRNELRLPQRGAKGFQPIKEQAGLFIAYATAPSQPASDGLEGKENGPYAEALAAELLEQPVSHLDLFQNVKERVLASTRGTQAPWESNGLTSRVFLTGTPKTSTETAPITVPLRTTESVLHEIHRDTRTEQIGLSTRGPGWVKFKWIRGTSIPADEECEVNMQHAKMGNYEYDAGGLFGASCSFSFTDTRRTKSRIIFSWGEPVNECYTTFWIRDKSHLTCISIQSRLEFIVQQASLSRW